MPNPREENPPAIQGAGEKDERGNYHSKHTAFGVGSSQSIGYNGKHSKDAEVVDIKSKKSKKKS